MNESAGVRLLGSDLHVVGLLVSVVRLLGLVAVAPDDLNGGNGVVWGCVSSLGHLLVCFAHFTSRCDSIGCPGELACKVWPNIQTTFSTHPSEVVELAPDCEETLSRSATPDGMRVHHIRGACSGGQG